MSAPLVVVDALTKEFRVPGLSTRDRRVTRAVNGVSFEISSGETLGLVGESGSGKTTTAYCTLLLEQPTTGSVQFDGVELTTASKHELRELRRRAQVVFQDPTSSLDPRMRVADLIAEPLVAHRVGDRRSQLARVHELLDRVGLPQSATERYPHEFSGGQRQRIGIARALALSPQLVVCDEPVAALDVSVQAQVVNLLAELQRELGLSYLFIAHDLAVVRHLAHRVAVMYLGSIVELAPAASVYESPRHPYTKALLSAVPVPDPAVEARRRRIVLEGDPPSPAAPPPGCTFHTRCWKATIRCRFDVPPLRELAPGHAVACHDPEPAAAGTAVAIDLRSRAGQSSS